jgi:hypothetical protein
VTYFVKTRAEGRFTARYQRVLHLRWFIFCRDFAQGFASNSRQYCDSASAIDANNFAKLKRKMIQIKRQLR